MPPNGPWMDALHKVSPYDGFPASSWKPDLQGWGSSPIFEAVIQQLRPSHVIEVGTWKGASAIHMAELMQKHGCDGEILCVDTWLGGPSIWFDESESNAKLPFVFGRAVLYEQFLANVIHRGQAKRIIPLPADSLTAAEVVSSKGLMADAIYLDAGHDYEHVSADLRVWWPMLRPGGVLFGDDYHVRWVGVVRAVHDFADKHNLNVQINFADKWLVQKPPQ